MKPSFKTDVIIGGGVLLIGILLVAVYLFTRTPGARVVVSIDGTEVARYALSEEVDVEVQSLAKTPAEGHNRLIIHDGKAHMEEADCPDRLCVGQGEIYRTNESIICLPHRVTIRIVGAEESAPDAIAGGRQQ